MSLFLLILKIIGYGLLIILGLVIVLLAVIFFLPIDYAIFYEKEQAQRLRVGVKLFYLVGINYTQDEHTNQIVIRLLGIPIKRIQLDEEEVEALKEDAKATAQTAADVQKEFDRATTPDHSNDPDRGVVEVKSTPLSEVPEQIQGAKKKRPTETQAKTKKSRLKEQPLTWKERLKMLWESPYRQGFLQEVMKLLKRFYHLVKPHTLRFRIKIGKDDPAETGILMAKLVALYPFIHRYGTVEGDYEKATLEGFVEVCGRLRLYKLLWMLGVFIIDKNVRNYTKIILSRKKVESNGI